MIFMLVFGVLLAGFGVVGTFLCFRGVFWYRKDNKELAKTYCFCGTFFVILLIVGIVMIACSSGELFFGGSLHSNSSSSSGSKMCTSCGKRRATIGTICNDCLNKAKDAFYG